MSLKMEGKISISDFPAMVGTIGNLDKSVQYYHMLEEQLRLYREELEKILNRIDGVDDITKFKAVNYEGSFKYDLPAIYLLIFDYSLQILLPFIRNVSLRFVDTCIQNIWEMKLSQQRKQSLPKLR